VYSALLIPLINGIKPWKLHVFLKNRRTTISFPIEALHLSKSSEENSPHDGGIDENSMVRGIAQSHLNPTS
jgi:hypothetical protein